MRVVGLLSWYDEEPGWLAECVAAAARLCDHLIAVDGPYALFPGSTRRPFSPSEQADVIARTCAGAGIGATIHAPRQPWWGGEVDKRDHMFRLAATMTTERDWLLRIDADEILTDIPPDTRDLLAATGCVVAEATLWQRDGTENRLRCLYRALPNLQIEQAHYVVTAGPTVLRGNTAVHTEADALALWDLRIEHRTGQRTTARNRDKQQYTRAVEDLGIEQVSPIREEVP